LCLLAESGYGTTLMVIWAAEAAVGLFLREAYMIHVPVPLAVKTLVWILTSHQYGEELNQSIVGSAAFVLTLKSWVSPTCIVVPFGVLMDTVTAFAAVVVVKSAHPLVGLMV
jgi:hypothetical protein